MPRLKESTAQARKQDILNAFEEILHEEGWDATSMRKVAKRAGVTTGAIYPHFSSKSDAIALLIKASLERLESKVRQASLTASDGDKIKAGASAFLEYFLDRPLDFDLGFYSFQGGRTITMDKATASRLNKKLAAVVEVFQHGIQAGFPDMTPEVCQEEAHALYVFLCGLMINARTHRDRSLNFQIGQLLDRYLGHLDRRDIF